MVKVMDHRFEESWSASLTKVETMEPTLEESHNALAC